MILPLHTHYPPFREDDSGALRVGNSRVLLELVVHDFLNGATPESIVQHYPSLSLADAYAAIGYYLHHQTEVDEYIRHREVQGEAIRAKIESQQRDMTELRARLLARKAGLP
jgi:uncharacterized protein (DUF433 family)